MKDEAKTVNPADVVIWSADVYRPTLVRVLSSGSGLRLVKLDVARLLDMGLSTIQRLQEGYGVDVFADAKINEIPDKVLEIAERYLRYRPWMLNVMAGAASTGIMNHQDEKKIDALKRFADSCRAVGTFPCAVTVLTSKSPDLIGREFNGRRPIDQVLIYAELLLEAGFSDMVCSPLEVRMIRSESRFKDLKLNTPGVRLPGSSKDDQSRVGTPRAAIKAGADRLVIGRDLTDGDFGDNFARIAANLNGD